MRRSILVCLSLFAVFISSAQKLPVDSIKTYLPIISFDSLSLPEGASFSQDASNLQQIPGNIVDILNRRFAGEEQLSSERTFGLVGMHFTDEISGYVLRTWSDNMREWSLFLYVSTNEGEISQRLLIGAGLGSECCSTTMRTVISDQNNDRLLDLYVSTQTTEVGSEITLNKAEALYLLWKEDRFVLVRRNQSEEYEYN